MNTIIKRAALALCAVFSGYDVFIGISLLYIGGRINIVCGMGIIASAIIILLSGVEYYTDSEKLSAYCDCDNEYLDADEAEEEKDE